MGKIDKLVEAGVKVNDALEFWGDLESYNDSLQEFHQSLEEKISNLEYYKNNQDFENYGILAHSIKSEAKYLGFMKEAETFLAHEMAGKNKDNNYILEHFEELQNVVASIVQLLASYEEKENSNKILIADDSSIILNFIEKNISEEYEVIKASNGKDAIEKVKNNNLYAILLDLNIPGGNGFEVLNYLEENDLIESIPVVIITGDDTEETIKKAFTYPILDVLNKPFTEENINRILASIKAFHEHK